MLFYFILILLYYRNNSEKSSAHKFENIAGIIKLPPNVNVNTTDTSLSLSLSGYLNKTISNTVSSIPHPTKQLFNPNNPNKPIVINKQQNARVNYTTPSTDTHHIKDQYPMNINSNTQQYSGAHFGTPPPAWYNPYTERYCNNIYVYMLNICYYFYLCMLNTYF